MGLHLGCGEASFCSSPNWDPTLRSLWLTQPQTPDPRAPPTPFPNLLVTNIHIRPEYPDLQQDLVREQVPD